MTITKQPAIGNTPGATAVEDLALRSGAQGLWVPGSADRLPANILHRVRDRLGLSALVGEELEEGVDAELGLNCSIERNGIDVRDEGLRKL